MRKVRQRTPSASADSVKSFDDVYPKCGINWTTQQKIPMPSEVLSNYNVNCVGEEPSNVNMHAMDVEVNEAQNVVNHDDDNHNHNRNHNNMHGGNNNCAEPATDDISMDDQHGDDEMSSNGEHDEEEKDVVLEDDTPHKPPRLAPSAPSPIHQKSKGKSDSVLAPNFNGKYKCLIRREIRDSKYFFLYEQNSSVIMTIRNHNQLNLKCYASTKSGEDCSFLSIGYVSVAVGDNDRFIIIHAAMPKCAIHNIVCKIFHYKNAEDKLYMGADDFIYYESECALSSVPWFTLIPFTNNLCLESVRNIFISRYHIMSSLYKVKYICQCESAICMYLDIIYLSGVNCVFFICSPF